MVFEPRSYRAAVTASDLTCFEVVAGETDLQILAVRDLREQALHVVRAVREPLERYIAGHPRFLESYVPLPVEPDAPEIIAAMARAGALAGVGPMAAVAGAVAQRVAEALSTASPEVLVENGGDLFLIGERERTVALWAGPRGTRGVGLRLAPDRLPCAVATSSGRIGHSVSFGDADAVTILSADGALADAVATAVANRVHCSDDLQAGLDHAAAIPGVDGAIVAVDGAIAAWGAVELVPVDADLA